MSVRINADGSRDGEMSDAAKVRLAEYNAEVWARFGPTPTDRELIIALVERVMEFEARNDEPAKTRTGELAYLVEHFGHPVVLKAERDAWRAAFEALAARLSPPTDDGGRPGVGHKWSGLFCLHCGLSVQEVRERGVCQPARRPPPTRVPGDGQ